MTNKTKKVKQAVSDKEKEPEFYYLNEAVKDYGYSDYVRITSFKRGVLLSFGKMQPDESKFSIFQEILLPFEIAISLSKIIKRQTDKMIEEGILQEAPIKKEDSK